MVTYSSILGLGNPMDRGAWQAVSRRSQRVGHYLGTKHQSRNTMGRITHFEEDLCI